MSDPSEFERAPENGEHRNLDDTRGRAACEPWNPDPARFLPGGRDPVERLRHEQMRLPATANRRTWRALEIGCGTGRLMRVFSRDFGEIHGVDMSISNEEAESARQRLADIRHAHVHVTSGPGLPQFADESFDFVYSCDVFRRVPDREMVLDYMRDVHRVLKPGGIFCGQFNGLPAVDSAHANTRGGCRFEAAEICAFTRENAIDLLELSGVATEDMWTTWRKRSLAIEQADAPASPAVRRLTNAVSREPMVANRGRYASMWLYIEGMPPQCELNQVEAYVGGHPATTFYVGPARFDGLRPQLGIAVPEGTPTGLQPVRVLRRGTELLRTIVRVVPPGPPLPRVVSITDGVNLVSAGEVTSGMVKVVTEEMSDASMFFATIAGHPVRRMECLLTDPLAPRCEFSFAIPAGVGAGTHNLDIRYGRRVFVFPITVV